MKNLEGIVDNKYLRLYDPDQWDRINAEYESHKYIPDYKIIGSIDGDALCLGKNDIIYIIPFIPMSDEYSEKYVNSIDELKEITESNMQMIGPDYKNFGLELHFISPLAFGGNPSDPQNRKYIPQTNHAELCRYWNTIFFKKLKENRI